MYDFLMGYIKHTEDDKTNTLIDLDPAAIDLSHHMYSPWLRGNWYIETEPDIFSFNFLGHVGKFMVVGKNIRVFDSNYPSGEYSVRFEDGSTPRFQITTGNGYSLSLIHIFCWITSMKMSRCRRKPAGVFCAKSPGRFIP